LGGEDGRHLVRLRGDKAHPASRGYACEKAHRLDHYQHARDRILSPLRRTPAGDYEPIGWEQANAEIAARLTDVRDRFGGASIFYYGGGGQGNHLPGAYATATRRALGSRYRSNALAQEKTGEAWVTGRMIGAYTRGDFEHAQVAMFLGKNPWHSHSFPHARTTLKHLARDPARTMIVVDPRRSETAAMADIHLQVRPGTDAWLLAAMVGRIVQTGAIDRAFVDAHTQGLAAVQAAFGELPVVAYAARAGIDEALLSRTVDVIAAASSFASYEDLGVQMNRHSTLVSYLHRLVWLLTGNFGRPGTHFVPTPLSPLMVLKADDTKRSPVLGERLVGGLVPCNAIAGEILTDHPGRYRAMIVEAANPAHSLAESHRFREAMRHLDVSVVIDVAMTETARQADFVLPAATQFEKAEATFFNFDFPDNVFHLRQRLFPPPAGVRTEAEIHAGLLEAMGALGEADYAPLREAAAQGRLPYAAAFMQHVLATPKAGLAAVIAYRTLGPTLPVGMAEAAVLFGAAFAAAMASPASLARAGFDGPAPVAASALFDASLAAPPGLVFARDTWEETFARLGRSRLELALPDLLDELDTLRAPAADRPAAFPFVLSAGERRSFTANTIVRDPSWRGRADEHALRLGPVDAQALGVASGDSVRLTTAQGSVVVEVAISEMMQPGHISLPNGLGVSYPGTDGVGVAPNELTSAADRDRFVGTPWHKSVPARLERITA
ncbi:MAG: molybdopterin-dependent oxidoreductase, partial [Myxococcales bacterium]|nr:molybdopterin-dependent oxidoreductase [Myxococcales bacterium]